MEDVGPGADPLIVFDADVPLDVPAKLQTYTLRPAPKGVRVDELDCPPDSHGDNNCYAPSPWRPDCVAPPITHVPTSSPDCGKPVDTRQALEVANTQLTNLLKGARSGEYKMAPGRVLTHVRVKLDAQGQWQEEAPPAPWMVMTSAQRTVGNYRVEGPGSRVLSAAREVPVATVLAWRTPAEPKELAAKHHSPAELRAEIKSQLLALRPRGKVYVQDIELVYYDSNETLMQPAYRFTAELFDRPRIGATEQVIGYVPYADTQERIPTLSDSELPRPNASASAIVAADTAKLEPDVVRVGRYVVQDDNKGWVRDSNEFMRTLLAPGSLVRFHDTQHVDAAPEHFTTDSARFVNGVDLALVEAHGSPWTIVTESNCCKPVSFDDSAFPALGRDNGGRLKHLALHSCDVLPLRPDRPDWAKPWQRVFGGLHSVLGYRSSMYINDGAGAAFAAGLATGAPVVAAWIGAITSLNIYKHKPYDYKHCSGRVAMGRPAAITACGADQLSASQTATFIPNCLDAWWVEDGVLPVH